MSVTPDTIATALGRPAPSDATYAQWDLWISDAEMLIEVRRAELDIDGPLEEAKLDYVIREAVVAQVKKPDDATHIQVTVDDASTSRRYESGKGRVTILDDWWTFLGLAATSDTSGAFTIRTAPIYPLPDSWFVW